MVVRTSTEGVVLESSAIASARCVERRIVFRTIEERSKGMSLSSAPSLSSSSLSSLLLLSSSLCSLLVDEDET